MYLLAWSGDPEVRRMATSGGFAKELLRHALESSYVDKLVFPRMSGTRTEVIVTDDATDLLTPATNSIYQPVSPLKGLSKLAEGQTCAITLLPCHVEALARRPDWRSKCKLVIELACGHVPHYKWTQDCLDALGVSEEDVAELIYRNPPWPGNVSVQLKSGEMRSIPFTPAWNPDPAACSPVGCQHCTRMGGESVADVLVADPWRLGEPEGQPSKTMVHVLNPGIWPLIESANISRQPLSREAWEHSMVWLRGTKTRNAERAT